MSKYTQALEAFASVNYSALADLADQGQVIALKDKVQKHLDQITPIMQAFNSEPLDSWQAEELANLWSRFKKVAVQVKNLPVQ